MASVAKRPLKVFLCHASGDKPSVRDLYKRLVAEGVDAWLDKEKLLPGQDWRLEIPRAVQEADVVVVCLSNKSVTKEGYVQKEIKFALDIAEEKPEGTIFLIPARLEDCAVPERLNRWQWVDLYEDNGFIQLLRSLKLRANAVGAVVEPASYEDSDKEIGRRLDQLYTEGLAAFYTEDWDRACHRFQSILSERPNHKNATEKLAEAERQRSLSKLYAQASEAVRSEDWRNAIRILEELTHKSAEYKDAAQLLRDARKQKQLRELYAEVKALHAAQQWEAVVKVFDQIASIDSNYPDSDELLPSAQKEVAELKRLAGLNDLYSHAVREMDAMNWYEARRLLESVHKSQTGFLETEKLLKKVENELAREEEKRRQNDEINTLYEQAHGLLRSKKWRNALAKMEEIRKLDERFPDADGITEKAQKELAREEQEAERQNKLAALYAEAVKLLKEEKYQEALDKWQEVKAIDPKYPDRQWVGRTAKKALTKQAKPVVTKARFVVPRLLWTGMGGVITIAVLAFAINQFGNIGSNSPQASVSATKVNTQVAASTTVKSPQKTNTPRPTVAVPVTGGYSDPTMYDDFDNVVYSGTLNTASWIIAGDTSFGKIYQDDSALVFNANEYEKNLGVVTQKDYNPITRPIFIEARMMLDPDTTVWGTDFGITFNADAGHSVCSIFAGKNTQEVVCWSNYFGVDQGSYTVKITPGTWHNLRVEVYPDTMRFSYVVDGKEIGAYVPQNSELVRDLKYALIARLNNWGTSAQDPVAYMDYIRIGAIEDEPKYIFYDEFSSQQFDGRYDTTKWSDFHNDTSSTKIIQDDGLLVIKQKGPDKGFGFIGFNGLSLSADSPLPANKYSYMEIKMMVKSGANKGEFAIQFWTDKTFFGCGLNGNYGGLKKYCWREDMGGGNAKWLVDYSGSTDKWYIYTIRIDPFDKILDFYFDEQNVASYQLADKETLPTGFGLGCHVAQDNDFQGYIDYVKLYTSDE